MWNGPLSKSFQQSDFIAWERCGHMSGLSARSSTAGLDDIRGASGLIRGARSKRVAGFSLKCDGISSQDSSFAWCTSLLPAAVPVSPYSGSIDHTVITRAAKSIGF
jgi:hypothetical protein